MCACLFDSFSDRNDGLGKKKTFQHRCKYSIEEEQKERCLATYRKRCEVFCFLQNFLKQSN